MKVAISVPDPIFAAGEHLAKQLRMSRSQLYSHALASYLSVRGAEAVTAQLDRIYSAIPSQIDPSLLRAQLQSVDDEAW
jgi:predicted transcriptional regulator